MDVIIINNLDEIVATGKYAKKGNESKWFEIDLESDGTYSVFGMVSGNQPTSITKNANYVKEWKTLKGVIKSLKTYSKDGRWGMKHWNTEDNS